MALLDSEGFGLSTQIADYLTYSAFRAVGLYTSSLTINTGGPQGDNYASNPTGAVGAGLSRLLPTTPTTFIVGFRAAFMSDQTNAVYFRDAAGNAQFQVEFSPTGQIIVVRVDSNSNRTVLTTTAAGTVPGTPSQGSPSAYNWVYIEIGATVSPTVGAVQIRVAGTVVVNLTNVNTNQGTGTTVSFIDWGFNSIDSEFPNGLMHIYISDTTGPAPWNTYLGDVRVQTLIPTANDSVQFATHGMANNYQNVSLAHPVPGTDYNASSTVGQQDTFVMQPVAGTIGTVFGVNVKPLLLKSDAGARSGASVLKSGAATIAGTSTPLLTTATQFRTMYQADPNTSAQWAIAAVNAIKPGYKISA